MDTFSESDPFAVMYVKTSTSQWVEVGRTEVTQNQANPVWTRQFIMDYFFEEVQSIKVDVYDEDTKGGDKRGCA